MPPLTQTLDDPAPPAAPAPRGAAAVSGLDEAWLADIGLGEVVELVRIDLPVDESEALLERGVMPGCLLCPVRRSPFGDPIVEVEGTVLALRREMAGCLCVRRAGRRAD